MNTQKNGENGQISGISFSPLLFTSLLFTAIFTASSDSQYHCTPIIMAKMKRGEDLMIPGAGENAEPLDLSDISDRMQNSINALF